MLKYDQAALWEASQDNLQVFKAEKLTSFLKWAGGKEQEFGLHPTDHSTAKVNISQPMLYTTAKSEQGDATCEADHIVESLNC